MNIKFLIHETLPSLNNTCYTFIDVYLLANICCINEQWSNLVFFLERGIFYSKERTLRVLKMFLFCVCIYIYIYSLVRQYTFGLNSHISVNSKQHLLL
ncbi:hypothetical protein J4Q44_G00205720, partial [Coregonus suidteri]